MLISFGCAWPASIYKSYAARSNAGKSPIFLSIILVGYISGVIYQYLASPKVHYIFYIFFINMFMVCLDMGLYYRNHCLEKKEQA